MAAPGPLGPWATEPKGSAETPGPAALCARARMPVRMPVRLRVRVRVRMRVRVRVRVCVRVYVYVCRLYGTYIPAHLHTYVL